MDRRAFQELIADYDQRITVDIGTGDGLYVYKRAQREPHRLFIGVDANRRPLQKISEKIYRRPAKSGLPNVLFVQAAVEALPSELDGIATEVQVQLPWGSLLQGVAGGDPAVMNNLGRICSPEARLQIAIGFDSDRDQSEWVRLGLSPVSIEYVERVLAARYRDAGFSLVEAKKIALCDQVELQTSWARRLQGNANRSVLQITACTNG